MLDVKITSRLWDIVVIGTGMGGATLGHALAKAGKSVLFLEKGLATLGHEGAVRGRYIEEAFPTRAVPSAAHKDILSRGGRCFEPILDESNGRIASFVPYIGCGTGGSSALSGMAMERFFPADFTPRAHHADADATLPESWPFAYDELLPFYAAAESLYHVRGTHDPLRHGEMLAHLPAGVLGEANRRLYDFLSHKSLHPYQLPIAHELDHSCPGCQGYLSPNGCKHDAAHVCVMPSVASHDATLLDRCEVVRLDANRRAVTGVVCEREGERFVVQGRNVMLAAGALATPALLLKSSSVEWPQGLANDSGLVGKNLMRHYVDLYAVRVDGLAEAASLKQLALNDLYVGERGKLGTVQSFGELPPAWLMTLEVADELAAAGKTMSAALMRMAHGVVTRGMDVALRGTTILASICEDLPYADNEMCLGRDASGSERIALRYRVRAQEARRIGVMRKAVLDMLSPHKTRLIEQAANNRRIAHVCGTCRAGDDPSSSVVDKYNRAHGLDNLYVVDASFFPSSGGTNPSLTIAANALRVAAMMSAS